MTVTRFLLSASWAMLALPAAAQTTPPAERPAPPPQRERSGDVVVTGAKTDVIASTDRTSFNLANDLQVQTGTMADALRAVPGVEVDLQGRVSLRGDPGVTILVDGRPSAMLRGDSRGDVLMSMPAGQIERVEVITNPSAAMSPEGSGGVINLVSKRVRPGARFATVRANIGDEGRGGVNVNGALTSKKLTVSGDLGYRRFTTEADAVQERARTNPSTGAVTTNRQDSAIATVMSARTGRVVVDYDIDPKNRLSGELTYRAANQDVARTDTAVSSIPAASYARLSDIALSNRSLGARTSWRRTLPGRGHELSADVEIERGRLRRAVDGVTSFTAAPASLERIVNAGERTDIDVKLDYKRPLGSDQSLNLGYAANIVDADFDYIGTRGGSLDALLPVPGLTNRFGFGQAVHALFGTWQVDHGKFEAQAGLRAEQVDLDLDQRTEQLRIRRDYFRLYPTLHLGYDLSDGEQLRGSYSRRIQRPGPQDLNPYTIYLDPLNLRRGKPSLRPEVTDSVEVAWQRRKGGTFYSLTGFVRTSRGGVTDVVEDLGGGVFLNTRANLATSDRVGIEGVANGKLSKTLTYNASATFLWNAIDPRQAGVATWRSGTTGTIRASLNWQPTPKDFFQASGNYAGRQLIAQGYRSPGGLLNLGYRRKVSERFSLTLTGQNVLDTARQVTVIDTPLLRDRVRQSGAGRIVLLGLSYTLGSQTGRRRPEPTFDFDQGGGAGPAG